MVLRSKARPLPDYSATCSVGECDHAVKVFKSVSPSLSATPMYFATVAEQFAKSGRQWFSHALPSGRKYSNVACCSTSSEFSRPSQVIPLNHEGWHYGMDMLSRKNGLGCKTDDLIVFSNRLIDVDPSLGYFVSAGRSFCGNSLSAAHFLQEGFDGNCDIIIWMQFYRCWIHWCLLKQFLFFKDDTPWVCVGSSRSGFLGIVPKSEYISCSQLSIDYPFAENPASSQQGFLKVGIDHKLVHADPADDRLLFITNQNVARFDRSLRNRPIAKRDCWNFNIFRSPGGSIAYRLPLTVLL